MSKIVRNDDYSYLDDLDYKKKRKRRIGYLFLCLLLTGIMLAFSTYAWFTANRIVSVDSLNVHVEAQGGIEISVDGTNWKTVVTKDDIEGAGATYGSNINQLPERLEPVSTGGIVSSGLLNMYYGSATGNTNGDYILSATKSDESVGSDGKFMAFDLFFKVDNASGVYLTPESTISFLGTKNPGVENSIRLGFLDEGTVAIGSALGTIQSLRNGTTDSLYIWEPNANAHSSTGISNALSVYGISIGSSNSPLSYSGVSSEIKTSANVLLKDANSSKYPNYFTNVDVDYTTSSGFSSNEKVFDFKAGITKMRIYIWIEGQDVDCENGSSSGDIEFKFQLTTNPS